MGSTYGIMCKNCDYEKSFKLGIGFVYAPRRLLDFEKDDSFSILSLLRSKKDKETVRDLVQNRNGVLDGDYSHRLYRCPKCGDFNERFFFTIKYEKGSFTPKYKCGKCRVQLEKVRFENEKTKYWLEDIDITKFPCPKCGKYELYEGEDIHINWD